MKNKYETFYWNMQETDNDETERLRWALSQYRNLFHTLCKSLPKGSNWLPDLGTDGGGSSVAMDLWLLVEGASKKLLNIEEKIKIVKS